MVLPVGAVTIGLVAGFISGLFGVGGGVIVVPGLVIWMGLSPRRATATSLATIAATAASAIVLFGVESLVDWRSAGLLLIGSVTGSVFATRWADTVSSASTTRVFAAVMLLAAGRMGLS